MDPLVRIAVPPEPRRPAQRTGVRAAAPVTAAAEIERRAEGNEAVASYVRRDEPAVRLALSEDAAMPAENPAAATDSDDDAPPRPGALIDRLA